MANEFTYFTQLLMYTTAIYAIILGIFLCIRRTEIKQRADDEPIEHQIMHRDERWTFTYTTPMRVMYDSTWGKKARPFLLVTRIVSVAFIFLSGIIVPATQDQSAFYYFDGWSIVLTFLYFCAVLTLTIITIYSYRTRSELDRQISEDIHWSYKIRTLAVWTHLLFEVCGASTIASIFINMQSFQSKSTVLELQTLVIFALLVLEMMLNNIRVRFDQLPASIAWMMFYFIVIWPAVMTGTMKDWPYASMSTRTMKCFTNYTVAFVGMSISHILWYALYKTKKLSMHFYFMYKEGPQAFMEENEDEERLATVSADPAAHVDDFYDPQTGQYYNPDTGYYDQPNAGQYWDPVTGQYYSAGYDSQYGYSQYGNQYDMYGSAYGSGYGSHYGFQAQPTDGSDASAAASGPPDYYYAQGAPPEGYYPQGVPPEYFTQQYMPQDYGYPSQGHVDPNGPGNAPEMAHNPMYGGGTPSPHGYGYGYPPAGYPPQYAGQGGYPPYPPQYYDQQHPGNVHPPQTGTQPGDSSIDGSEEPHSIDSFLGAQSASTGHDTSRAGTETYRRRRPENMQIESPSNASTGPSSHGNRPPIPPKTKGNPIARSRQQNQQQRQQQQQPPQQPSPAPSSGRGGRLPGVAHIQRTPTALFGNRDADVDAFAFGFDDL